MREAKIALVVVLVVLVMCVAAALGVLIYRPQLLAPPVAEAAEGPAILIDSPSHGDEVSVGQAVQVFATGYDSGKIERMQLWVDGAMVISQSSALPEGMNPFPLLATWVPQTLGNHILVVRGYNVAGVPGQATITVFGVEGPEIATEMPAEGCAGVLLIAHRVQEGETLEGIAAEYEMTVEDILACNPGLDPLAALVPGQTLMVPYMAAPEEEESGLPGVELPVVEPTGGVEEASPSPEEELPMVRPTEYVGQGGDQEPLQEDAEIGEERPSDVLEGPETQEGVEVQEPEEPRAVLGVEALDLEVDQPYAAGYCLVRFGEGDMERVPGGNELFSPPAQSTQWDIAHELGGVENSRTVPVYGNTLHLEIHCYAFADLAGAEPIALGAMTRDHTELEWRGQPLEATSEGGDEGSSFTLSYRICPVTCYPAQELLAPYLLEYVSSEAAGVHALSWRWDGDRATIDGFRVYRNGALVYEHRAATTVMQIEEGDAKPPCGQTYEYRVSAHRGPIGVGVESPLSDPLPLPPDGPELCPLRATLTFSTMETMCLLSACPRDHEANCTACNVRAWYGRISAHREQLVHEAYRMVEGRREALGPQLYSYRCDSWCDWEPFRRGPAYSVEEMFGQDFLVADLGQYWDMTLDVLIAAVRLDSRGFFSHRLSCHEEVHFSNSQLRALAGTAGEHMELWCPQGASRPFLVLPFHLKVEELQTGD